MIPAHGWGGTLCVAGDRLMAHGGVWAIIGPEGSVGAAPTIKPFPGRIGPITDPAAPDTAWRGSARELLALLAPAIGAHCNVCDDFVAVGCPCCDGDGELKCSDHGCEETHECSRCGASGSLPCACAPHYRGSMRIGGARFRAAPSTPCRGLLHAAGDAPCVMWVGVVPRAHATAHDNRVLFVDVAGHRFALAAAIATTPTDESTWGDEVTL